MERRIERALISVSDKSGIVEFARGLVRFGVELVSTGGTAATLVEAGLPVRRIEDFTGFPELLDGRVKTLHPKVHGGLLFRRDDPAHAAQAAEHGIEPIDLVAVNLYPFEATAARPDIPMTEVVEQVDIGGPAMIRSAAKNYQHVAVIVNPARYDAVLAEMQELGGALSENTRLELATEVFRHTSCYDSVIAHYLASHQDLLEQFPEQLAVPMRRIQRLRYGENPHQAGALYRDLISKVGGVAGARQLQGKELSYNNIMDADAAWAAAREIEDPFAIVIKHANPCGAALGTDIVDAYCRAYACDPESAFGGIVAVNRPVTPALAEELAKTFLEVVIAPAFEPDATAILAAKKAVRLLEAPPDEADTADLALRRVSGGYLMQEEDCCLDDPAEWHVATAVTPSPEVMGDLVLAWRLVKWVKSNAIVLARGGQLVAVGPGQTSRVGSVEICIRKAGAAAAGSAMASDAFFPFPDGPRLAIEGGVRAIIQPGGSKRDQETIDLCNDAGVPMIFTGRRHFRH